MYLIGCAVRTGRVSVAMARRALRFVRGECVPNSADEEMCEWAFVKCLEA